MAIERTLVLVKPDGMQRGLAGEILSRYERRGLKIVALKLMLATRELAAKHYAEHVEKPFYPKLAGFITSSPLIAAVVEGPDAIEIVRETNGKTNPVKAAPGTIRADFGVDMGRNLVHASDGADAAQREIGLWFKPEEILSWTRATDSWIVEP